MADAVRRALDELRAEYARRYGAAVFDISAEEVSGGVVLRGRVLVPSQRQAAVAAARRVAEEAAGDRSVVASRLPGESDRPGVEVHDLIEVLVQLPGGEFHVPDRTVSIMSAPDGELASELSPGDPPLRRLAVRGDWWAVELADGTVGWVRQPGLRPAGSASDAAVVASWRAAYRGSFRRVSDSEWAMAADEGIGVPYRWGGTTRGGVDCSGLVQRLVRQVSGLGLPKHSADQIRAGRRVALTDVRPGDVLYLTHADSGVRHVALVLVAEPLEVVHAGIGQGVRRELVSSLLRRYRMRGAARFDPDEPS